MLANKLIQSLSNGLTDLPEEFYCRHTIDIVIIRGVLAFYIVG